ncbi:glycosyltransferase family 2 protein [Weissella cibaria]|uniref:glycosyltransferase family 2 protein n=1 Tax=Weissella cibaria TaxID=137591 RepID=UPI00189BFCA1|nr:glycosyltransferase family A protein [Weissella cibaria]
MNSFAVSLIVVNYNGEVFLKKLLEMIRSQTFEDFEVVFVDDGSNDKSLEIVQKYMGCLKIQVLKLEHKGVGFARQKGVENAKGKYVMFLDADDYILPKFIETYYTAIEKELSDVLFLSVLKGATFRTAHVVEIPSKIGTTCISQALLTGEMSGWLFQTISDRRVWENNSLFGQINYAEDLFALLQIASEGYDFKIATECNPQYFYRHNPNSLTEKTSWENINSMIEAAEYARKFNFKDNRRKLYHLLSKKMLLNALGQSLVSGDSVTVGMTKKKLLSKRNIESFSWIDIIRIKLGLYAVRNRMGSFLSLN